MSHFATNVSTVLQAILLKCKFMRKSIFGYVVITLPLCQIGFNAWHSSWGAWLLPVNMGGEMKSKRFRDARVLLTPPVYTGHYIYKAGPSKWLTF